MSKIINLKEKILVKSKEKEWQELGKKYGADKLEVVNNGDPFYIQGNYHSCVNIHGYILTWKTEEDDIYVGGDNAGSVTSTMIKVDTSTYKKESIVKLTKALKCLKEIESNRDKYYHKNKDKF